MIVKYSGTEHKLPDAGLADMVAFERAYSLPSSVLSEPGESRVEYMCFLAYRGLKKLGVVTGVFDDAFLDNLESIDFEEDGDAPEDPTAEAVPSG